MDRAEFMRRLTALLSDVPPAEREEAIQYYNDYFDDAGEDNEQSVIASLGSPEELAKSIKAGLSDGGSTGEFTEYGFRGFEERRKNEVMRTQGPDVEKDEQNGGPQQQFSGQQYTYGGPGSQGNSYGGSGNQGNPYGGSGNQGNPYGGQNGRTGYSGQSAGNHTQSKRKMSGGMIALIVILAILLSPAWIGLLGGLFGGFVGLLAGLFGIVLAFLIVGVVMAVVGIALIVTGIAAMFGMPLGGLCLIGLGLVLIAIGLVFIWLMVLMVGTAIPALVRGVVNLCQRFFHRGGVRA